MLISSSKVATGSSTAQLMASSGYLTLRREFFSLASLRRWMKSMIRAGLGAQSYSRNLNRLLQLLLPCFVRLEVLKVVVQDFVDLCKVQKGDRQKQNVHPPPRGLSPELSLRCISGREFPTLTHASPKNQPWSHLFGREEGQTPSLALPCGPWLHPSSFSPTEDQAQSVTG